MAFCCSKLLPRHICSEPPFPSPGATISYSQEPKPPTAETLEKKAQSESTAQKEWLVYYSLQTYPREVSWGEGGGGGKFNYIALYF